ncbi:two-component system, OmpR family, sensor histidine kinase SenX3 [Streptoalloteichus tenebrarius]|uniref:Sensor-like histidine kinase SenX3 n=1 Tax=Streptoalloteichus tenebrarius (strain ATCC 17920 / DSM 40477 / JCM 4838 / CBS 697.72 / NBRC 16177 / NCIMB 11028 / NRRL B-12390 / A12253. 1 / ISP 5477) TaxID=1933 RepID=A0ABT1I1N6_STRSD|nr:ATP-binding protein [Streptoalloteichus tenebrarius]MCP2261703.1 two-component system, OmpR family, sensor histidine kinase SenX3 [Streptoalloteichus tenebrarius]BFF02414.1 ATP-binding protein [Streptoalloteichus tenebrarius]
MTASGYLALTLGAVLAAAVVAFLLGRAHGARHPRRPAGVTVAELVQRVVHSAHNGVAVINRFGDVVLHNPRAAELGVVRSNRADARAIKAAEQVLETGDVVHVDLSPLERGALSGRGPAAVLGEARPLGDGFVVVDAADESDAVRLEATRRDFVANVSHELKTPVGALALLAEAVLDAADDPDEVRRFGGKILHEATRLGSLVTELIALSRLQGAERLPELATVEVDEVVREALARCRLAAESAGIEIAVDEPSGMEVDGDRTLLVTALTNLVDNAISYSPPGSPVSVSRRAAEGFVEIAVTDRGIGIAPEHQERVFERFFRVDPARSRATGGTGLGLAIVKHVAANHGGEVRLWSRPGTGSTFTLRIPAHGAAHPAVPAEQSRQGEAERSTRAHSLVPSSTSAAGQPGPGGADTSSVDHGGVL